MNRYLKITIILFILSMPLLGYGTHLQAVSPNFESYQQHQIDQLVAENPGKDLAPGYGLGLMMASAWPFSVLCQALLMVAFIAGILLVRFINKRTGNKYLPWQAYSCLSAFSAYGILVYIGSAVESFRWGFILLGVAQVVTSSGVAIGCIGLFREVSCQTGKLQ